MDLLLAAAEVPVEPASWEANGMARPSSWHAAQSLAGLSRTDLDARADDEFRAGEGGVRKSNRRKRRVGPGEPNGISDDSSGDGVEDDHAIAVSPSLHNISPANPDASLLTGLSIASCRLSRSAPETYTTTPRSNNPLLRFALAMEGDKRARTMSDATVSVHDGDEGRDSPPRDDHEPIIFGVGDLAVSGSPQQIGGSRMMTAGSRSHGGSSANGVDFVDARRSALVDGVPQPLSLDPPPRPLLYDDLINFPRSRGKSHARRCVMCGHLASGDQATCSIPLQNKDVCKRCDTGIWKHRATAEYFKWCKGCKKFLHVCSFAEKLSKCATKYSKQPSKCDRCRERGRQSYMSKRMELDPAQAPDAESAPGPPPKTPPNHPAAAAAPPANLHPLQPLASVVSPPPAPAAAA